MPIFHTLSKKSISESDASRPGQVLAKATEESTDAGNSLTSSSSTSSAVSSKPSVHPLSSRKICQIGSHCLFMAYALALLSYGVYQNVRSRPIKLHDHLTWGTTNGWAAIVTGALDIGLGVCGLVGVFLNKLYMHWINVAMLSVSVLGSLIFIIAYSVSINGMARDTKTFLMDTVSKNYGAEPDFTALIDSYQTTFKCCDWTDSPVDIVYLTTPWHRMTQNQTDAKSASGPVKTQASSSSRSSSSSSSSSSISYPDSCCVIATDRCRKATNKMDAMRDKYIHGQDCLAFTIKGMKAVALTLTIMILMRKLFLCALFLQYCMDCGIIYDIR